MSGEPAALAKLDGWAPIVFGRTAYVDFRPNFLAHPEWLTEAEIKALKAQVLLATEYSDKHDIPRRVMFRRGNQLVIGEVALASHHSTDMTHELKIDPSDGSQRPQRRLFSFTGYAKQVNPGEAVDIPALGAEWDRAMREAHEECLRPRFLERLTDANWEKATLTQARTINAPVAAPATEAALNANSITMMKAAEESQLWARGAKLAQGPEEFAVGSNIATQDNARPNPNYGHKNARAFDVFTVAGEEAESTLPRIKPDGTARAADAATHSRAQTNKTNGLSVDPAFDPEGWDAKQAAKTATKTEEGFVAMLKRNKTPVAIGAAAVVVAGGWALYEANKRQEAENKPKQL